MNLDQILGMEGSKANKPPFTTPWLSSNVSQAFCHVLADPKFHVDLSAHFSRCNSDRDAARYASMWPDTEMATLLVPG